ncbi:MAG: hypothetical protein FWD26_03685 [Treponema sp.]|nr:hypothetical protein [Treponema sp.]
MKAIRLYLPLISVLLFISCEVTYTYHYYKCFFIAEDSFTIHGAVFVNDRLTEGAEFEKITVRVESVNDWEIEGVKTTGNGFTMNVNAAANGITLSNDTLNSNLEPTLFSDNNSFLYSKKFPYHVLVFNVDGRRARGAYEQEFGSTYYYVYIPDAVDASSERNESYSLNITYYSFDLDFYRPGWYKIYYSKDNSIGNNAAYSSGSNTRIRAPR